jgi:hypothetical protein
MEYIPSDYQTCMNKYKKDRFFEITNSPYDRLWILPTTMLSENETFDELDEEATTAQIRTAFKKMYKNKSTNKKMLTSFARSVA